MLSAFLGEIVVKTTVILAAAFGITAVMVRSSAAARHLIWSTALFATLLLPSIVWYVPHWSLPVLPALSRPPVEVRPFVRLAGSPVESQVHEIPTQEEQGGLNQMYAVARQVQRHWAPLVAILWMAVGVIGLVRISMALLEAARIARGARCITDADCLALAEQTAAGLHLKREISLRSTDRTTIPLTCGLWNPVLLLPEEAKGWSTERRRAVMLHELAHVKRHDCLQRVCAQMAGALYWFNPLVQFAVRRLRAEQENACDDVVLTAGIAAPDYADHLFDIALGSRVTTLEWATLAMARISQLEGRMLTILDATRYRQAPTRRVRVMAILAMSVAVLLLGALQLSATNQSQGGATELLRDYAIPQWSRYVEEATRDRVGAVLTVALDDENEQVRQEAGHVLDVLREQPPGPVVVTSPCRGNCIIDDTPWTYWSNMWEARDFSNPDVEIRRDALRTSDILRVSTSGAAALAQALMDSDQHVRTWAAIKLDSVRSVEAMPAWISVLTDRDASLRERAAISLGAIGDPQAIEALTSTLLHDTEPPVRLQAARALGYIALGGEG
jgi:beta-lactamase regulating signal transducer with metallopeptidase domain